MKNSSFHYALFLALFVFPFLWVPVVQANGGTASNRLPCDCLKEAGLFPEPLPFITYPDNTNPLSGLPATDENLWTFPPFLIPIVQFPETVRPSAGLSFAPWVFEFYADGGESRPFALFYGELPRTDSGVVPYVGALGSAVFGAESLRLQYQAVLLTAGNSQSVVKAGLNNSETWYGESGKELYPKLPVSRLEGYMRKWKKILGSPDQSAIQIPFGYAIPAGGKKAESLNVSYAPLNQILWRYDAQDGLYHRMQNAEKSPAPMDQFDVLDNQPITAQNVVILFVNHQLTAENLHTVDFNYVKKNPAVVFRDGLRYEVFWTTKPEEYEWETKKLRPIRLIEEDGSPFLLKPGQSWVHIMHTISPLSEVNAEMGKMDQPDSGHWRIPFVTVKP